MYRRPPRSTRTDTLFPHTTLFRALRDLLQVVEGDLAADVIGGQRVEFGLVDHGRALEHHLPQHEALLGLGRGLRGLLWRLLLRGAAARLGRGGDRKRVV